jgi:ABC-type glucose/galactose transport system permease subunit
MNHYCDFVNYLFNLVCIFDLATRKYRLGSLLESNSIERATNEFQLQND